MPKELFRKAALEKIASPEQLDHTIRIVNPRGWIALAGVALLMATVLVWGITGEIPEKVVGTGVLLSSGRVSSINAPARGMIKDIFIKNGDTVKKGQIIARIQRDDLLDQLQLAIKGLEDLEENYRAIQGFSEENLKLTESKLSNMKQSLEAQKGMYVRQRNGASDGDKGQSEPIGDDGTDSIDAQIQDIEIRLASLNVDRLKVTSETKTQLMSLGQRVAEARKNVEILQLNYQSQTKVTSGVSGKVFEVSVDKGNYVDVGTSIAIVESAGSGVKKFQGVLYVDAREGKKIKRGMNIAISPSTVKQEEYGYILGIVTEVSDFPVTSQYILNTLHHDGLMAAFSDIGNPIEIKADLIPDMTTYSKYKWSSSKGPDMTINSGLLCTGSVSVGSHRPISLVMPLIKRKVFGVGEGTPDPKKGQ